MPRFHETGQKEAEQQRGQLEPHRFQPVREQFGPALPRLRLVTARARVGLFLRIKSLALIEDVITLKNIENIFDEFSARV